MNIRVFLLYEKWNERMYKIRESVIRKDDDDSYSMYEIMEIIRGMKAGMNRKGVIGQ